MKNDDPLLRRLGAVARAESADEAPSSPEEEALAVPLDDAAKDRITEALLAKTGKGAAARAEAASPTPTGKVIPLRRKLLLGSVPALAAAAALVLFFVGRPSPALPGYTLELDGGRKVERAVVGSDEIGSDAIGSDEVARYGPGDRLRLVLRPDAPVSDEVGLRAFLVGAGGTRVLSLPFEASPEGALRVDAPVDDALPVPPGRYELVVVVGRPDALPAVPDAAGASALVLRRAIERVGP